MATRIDDEPTEHPVRFVGDVVTSDFSSFDDECRPLLESDVEVDQIVELDNSASNALLRLATAAGSDLSSSGREVAAVSADSEPAESP